MSSLPSLSGILHRLSLYNPLSFHSNNADDFIVTTTRGNASDETSIVWLLDSTASKDANDPSKWSIDLVAAFFAARTGAEITEAVADVSSYLGLADNAAERKLVEERARPFFLAVLPDRNCEIQFGEDAKTRQRIKDTDAGGVSRTHITLDGPMKDGQVISAHVVDEGSMTCLKAHTTFAEEEGW